MCDMSFDLRRDYNARQWHGDATTRRLDSALLWSAPIALLARPTGKDRAAAANASPLHGTEGRRRATASEEEDGPAAAQAGLAWKVPVRAGALLRQPRGSCLSRPRAGRRRWAEVLAVVVIAVTAVTNISSIIGHRLIDGELSSARPPLPPPPPSAVLRVSLRPSLSLSRIYSHIYVYTHPHTEREITSRLGLVAPGQPCARVSSIAPYQARRDASIRFFYRRKGAVALPFVLRFEVRAMADAQVCDGGSDGSEEPSHRAAPGRPVDVIDPHSIAPSAASRPPLILLCASCRGLPFSPPAGLARSASVPHARPPAEHRELDQQ